jgi:hypothetical protein
MWVVAQAEELGDRGEGGCFEIGFGHPTPLIGCLLQTRTRDAGCDVAGVLQVKDRVGVGTHQCGRRYRREIVSDVEVTQRMRQRPRGTGTGRQPLIAGLGESRVVIVAQPVDVQDDAGSPTGAHRLEQSGDDLIRESVCMVWGDPKARERV